MAAVGRRAVLAALAANVAVAVSKLGGFLVTGSASLLAETFHSLADSGNQLLLLLGGYLASEQPSPRHPFGRGRERFFWAFVVGLVLFGLGGVFAIHEGLAAIRSPDHAVSSPEVAVALIIVAAVLEAMSLRTGLKEADRLRPDGQRWWTFLRRTRNPEVTVVILEDGAALVGLGFALVGVVGSWSTGNPRWDGWASIAIGLLLCVAATTLTVQMKRLLIGETVPPAMAREIKEAIVAVIGVDRLLNLRTEHLGPDQVLVCVKIAIAAPADLDQVVRIINTVEDRVQTVLPDTMVCYVEPDRFDRNRVDAPWS